MLGNKKLWSCSPTGACTLPSDVQVWAAWLNTKGEGISEDWSTLSSQERERASRFTHELDRARFVASHGILRAILGSCLGTEPKNVEYCYSSRGKPSLGGDWRVVGCNSIWHTPATLRFSRWPATILLASTLSKFTLWPSSLSLSSAFFRRANALRSRDCPAKKRAGDSSESGRGRKLGGRPPGRALQIHLGPLTFEARWVRRGCWVGREGPGYAYTT